MTDEKTQISLLIPSELLTKLDRIAQGTDRAPADVINEAIEAYLRNEGQEILDEIDGFAALDAGLGVDADEMILKARAIVAARRADQGAP